MAEEDNRISIQDEVKAQMFKTEQRQSKKKSRIARPKNTQ